MYILVTPAKNEERDLPLVADSVVKQTIRPSLWFIVDDGSTDGTPGIIRELENTYDWIKSIRLPPRGRDITYHYAYVCKEGFDNALLFSGKHSINYDYIGLLDADSVLEPDFFEKLIDAFKVTPGLGIVSGGVYQNINDKVQWSKSNEKLPLGTGRLWAKKCFIDTGGYTVEPAPDSISNVKAIIRGWEIEQIKDAVNVQTRLTSSAEGLWKGHRANGFMAYYVNKHPLLVLLNIAFLTRKKPYYLGIPFAYGYILSWLKREKQTDDEEIRKYYWETRLNEYKLMLRNKLFSSGHK